MDPPPKISRGQGALMIQQRNELGRIRAKNVLERLWAISEGCSDEECWEYGGKCKGAGGHKRIRLDDKSRVFVHRLAWEAHHAEPVPEGFLVLHKCDNPSCFNPSHLFLGTHQDNSDDKIRKGRLKPYRKIPIEALSLIRSSNLPNSDLAREYGVTSARIGQIKRDGRAHP